MTIGGVTLEPARRYHAATHSGMLSGVHRYGTFAEGGALRTHDARVTEVVERGLRSMAVVSPLPAGAITLITEAPSR